MPSNEETAFRRLVDEVRPPAPESEPPLLFHFGVPEEVLREALIQAVRDELRHSSVIREHLATQVSAYLKEIIPESPEFQAIKEELRIHLSRYPSLGMDPQLEEKVALAIFGHIQGPKAYSR